nr:Unknown Function [uncultured bacterium]
MPHRRPNSPLGAFLEALEKEEIPCILIGGMAAIEQGAPVTTLDYDFWLPLPERQYIRILAIIKRLGGNVIARTLYELSDGTQVNVIFNPDGLNSFLSEFRRCHTVKMGGMSLRVLPLTRVIASKQAAAREKDLAILPLLRRTLRLRRRLKE